MKSKHSIWFFIAAALQLLVSCRHREDRPTLFTLLDNTGIAFNNTVTDSADLNIINYRNFYNGGGVAIGDLNNDGLPEVFFTANQASNRLFLNKGNMQFADISVQAGFTSKKQWSNGVVFVDVNNDGWLDIYISNAGSLTDSSLRTNQLFINQHNLTFKEEAAAYGLNNAGYTTQVSFFDYDLDGDLDCFMINNSPISPTALNNLNKRELPDAQWNVPANMKGGGDHLYRNDDGHYREVTTEAGIHGSLISFGLGVTVGDVNGDGYPDVYVSNDFYERDYLYINQQNGTFKDEAEQWMQHTSLASMGADFGDINNDGYPDIFTTDMLPGEDYRLKTTLAFEDITVYRLKQKNGFYHQFFQNTMQLNNRNGGFVDVANATGVAATDWSWGGLMFDANNDGFNDLYVCNGINHDLINQDFLDFSANDIVQKMKATGKKEDLKSIVDKMPTIHVLNKVFENKGDLQFKDVGEEWGFTQPSFSNGAAYGDLDNDGDLDLIVNNVNQPAFVYRNNSTKDNKNHYVAVRLSGTEKNRFAVGAKVKLYQQASVFTRELIPSRGFQSSMDYKMIVGLGANSQVDSLVVEWPGNVRSVYLHPQTDTTLFFDQLKAQTWPMTHFTKTMATPYFSVQPSPFDQQVEDDYVDFYNERNVPKMLSREGPKAAVGDVNNDQLEDLVIGGTKDHPAQVYLQQAGGKWLKKLQPQFSQFADFEDGAVLLFDADKDNDLDLLIAPSGNTAIINSRQIQLRLFKNDGKGNFGIDAKAFNSNNFSNCNAACVADFDGNGTIDLFIGGRNITGQYGTTPPSLLFKNDGAGRFAEVTDAVAPGLKMSGMITGAQWADMDGNQQPDLIVSGEWMAPKIFYNNNGKLAEKANNLSELKGWWQSLEVADVNQDGKPDLILGNNGNNFYLHPSKTHPVRMWLGDFDQNGIQDKILTYTIDGKDKPVLLKHDLEEALPILKKENLRHAVYAEKSIEDLIGKPKLTNAVVREFNYSSSIVAINQGNGQFLVQELPVMAQMSCINAIKVLDVNADGKPDLVCGGNEFNFLPQLERLDANLGEVLINKGNGKFAWTDANQTGLLVRGQVKDLVHIHGANATWLLFLQNDDVPLLYQLNQPKPMAKK